MILSMSNTRDFEPSGNSRSASKSFSISIPFLRSKAQADAVKNKASLSEVKLRLELSFQDIESAQADRLRHKIRATREVKELWMLRSDAHQLISRQMGQQEAAKRINALLTCFAQWMPEKSLVKI